MLKQEDTCRDTDNLETQYFSKRTIKYLVPLLKVVFVRPLCLPLTLMSLPLVLSLAASLHPEYVLINPIL